MSKICCGNFFITFILPFSESEMAFGRQCVQQSPIVQIPLQVKSELLPSKWKRNFRQQSIIAPGTRIKLRNDEWLVRRVAAT